MDILKKLHATAHQVARDGLEILGVSLPTDDSGSSSSDIFGAYRRFVEKSASEPEPVFPVPQEIQNELLPIARSFCADHTEAIAAIDAWAADRKSRFSSLESPDCTSETAQTELCDILQSFDLLSPPGDNWVSALQTVARAQKRPVSNLIFQAASQIEESNLDSWIAIMNDKLRRFHLRIAFWHDMLSIANA